MQKILLLLFAAILLCSPAFAQTNNARAKQSAAVEGVNNTKLDDLKNPFDTTKKVKTTNTQHQANGNNSAGSTQKRMTNQPVGWRDDSLLWIKNPVTGKVNKMDGESGERKKQTSGPGNVSNQGRNATRQQPLDTIKNRTPRQVRSQ